jgi:hypothetical protein
VTGGAHDTLRDELADFFYDATTPRDEDALADAVLPVVLRFADAQVAAERERANKAERERDSLARRLALRFEELEHARQELADARHHAANELIAHWSEVQDASDMKQTAARIARGQP